MLDRLIDISPVFASIAAVLLPFFAFLTQALLGKKSKSGNIALFAIAGSTILSLLVFADVWNGAAVSQRWEWFAIGESTFHFGILLNNLTALMQLLVCTIALPVHLYSRAYMKGDAGIHRYWMYLSLFCSAMLGLTVSVNLFQMYVFWELVGFSSYLLIGFWFVRESAVRANKKAFLVNRIGDLGFLVGLALLFAHFGTLDITALFGPDGVFRKGLLIDGIWTAVDKETLWMTVAGVAFFLGAMAKSAQFPLHVWLPDSMEGPTPISALIHAATMVTAGIFMVARMSPLYELSETALQFILFIGATTAFFTGLMGMVQSDIKRVVAYSTLSQLGYMTVALGVSAYSAAVYHLMTHAFFKALLFLAAGSVIIGMHHEQDMRKMGGLRKYMPVTFWTSVIGTLALVGTPFFSGFYSKDTIIEAAKHATEHGSWINQYAYWSVLLGAFVTSFYSFRLLYLTYFGKERFRDAHAHGHHDDHGHHGHGAHEPHESPKVVTVPLILLAIASIVIGYFTVGPMLFGTDWTGHHEAKGFFDGVIHVLSANDTLAAVKEAVWHGPNAFALHGLIAPAFWLVIAGFLLATVMYWWKPELADKARAMFALPVRILENKYGMDDLWIKGFAGGGVLLGKGSREVDSKLIDGVAVNGSAKVVDLASSVLRHLQSGYLYHYAFAMIVGLIVLLAVLIGYWR